MKELIELGIDVSKASMCWIGCADENDVYPYNSTFKDIFENHKETMPSVLTPTFTLQDILSILPEEIQNHKLESDLKGYIHYVFRGVKLVHNLKAIECETMLEAAFNMLKWSATMCG